MYGTVARMRIVPGHEQQIERYMQEWNDQRSGQVAGFVTGYLLTPDTAASDRLMVAIFQDRGTYRKNAEDPEQDAWYRRMREHLVADPEWTDGEIAQMS